MKSVFMYRKIVPYLSFSNVSGLELIFKMAVILLVTFDTYIYAV